MEVAAVPWQLKGSNSSEQSWFGHQPVLGQVFQVRPMPRFDACVALGFPLQQLEAGHGRGTAQGVGGEAMAMEKRAVRLRAHKALIKRLTGQGHAHRQKSCRESFGEGDDVGCNASAMAGKQAAAAAKAREHLIGNHQGTRRVGPLLDGLQERLTHHRHATGSLQ